MAELWRLRGVESVLHTEARAKLLATARRAFAEHGYANTAMDEFTAAVGLTRGALYHHFGSKEKLLIAVIAWGVVLLHVAAALFRHRVRKDNVLTRMLP